VVGEKELAVVSQGEQGYHKAGEKTSGFYFGTYGDCVYWLEVFDKFKSHMPRYVKALELAVTELRSQGALKLVRRAFRLKAEDHENQVRRAREMETMCEHWMEEMTP
jgi:hypothetical protein